MMAPNTSSRPDLANRDDIVRLVNRFYERIREDEKLGPVFNHIAAIDWDTHLPKMYDFWDTVMFRSGTYQGNPISAHARLAPLTDMGWDKFEHWLSLFRDTVDELFDGDKAGHIVRCAEDMANVLYSKIKSEIETLPAPELPIGCRDPSHRSTV